MKGVYLHRERFQHYTTAQTLFSLFCKESTDKMPTQKVRKRSTTSFSHPSIHKSIQTPNHSFIHPSIQRPSHSAYSSIHLISILLSTKPFTPAAPNQAFIHLFFDPLINSSCLYPVLSFINSYSSPLPFRHLSVHSSMLSCIHTSTR